MKAGAMYYTTYDSYDSESYETYYVIGSIVGCVFWITVIYCCIRACRKTEAPQVVQIIQNPQPQVHYIIQQDAIGPDGNPLPAAGTNGAPIMYQQIQGQFVPVTGYQPPTVVTQNAYGRTIESQNTV